MSVTIVPLPCGCTADPQSVRQGKPEDRKVLWCPWCDAAFDVEEFREWINGGHRNPFVSPAMPIAMCDAQALVEIVGLCDDCSNPMVRERERGSKAHHCKLDRLQFMHN